MDLDEPFYLLYAYGGNGGDDGVSITKHTRSGVVPNMVSLGENIFIHTLLFYYVQSHKIYITRQIISEMSVDPTALVTAMVVPMPSTVSSVMLSAPGTTTEMEILSTGLNYFRLIWL